MVVQRALITFTVFLVVGFFACDDDADDRNKFLGRYEVKEQSLETYVPRNDYEVRIRKDLATTDEVIIYNFYNLGIEVYAVVNGNSLTVPRQQHQVYEYEGSGNMSGNVITVEYTVSSTQNDSSFFDRLRAEMTLVD